MRKHYIGLIIVFLIIFAITNFVQVTRAFNFNYSDNVWEYITVQGPDIVKAGNVESFNVSGKLLVEDNGPVHFYFWVDTQSQQQQRIYEDEIFPLTELGVPYPAGYEYFKTCWVTIPSDTINNSYLWIKIDAESSNFSSIPISLVQYPSYDDLQQQNSNLSSTLNDTQSQLTNALSSLSSANSQINDLQAQLADTQSQLNSSQSQNIILQSQLDSTQSQLSGAQSLANNLIIFSVIAVIAAAIFGLSTIYLMRKAK